MGIINTQGSIEFNIHIGDVIFFPIGTQHYIKNTCDEDLLFILAFSTGDKVRISPYKREFCVSKLQNILLCSISGLSGALSK